MANYEHWGKDLPSAPPPNYRDSENCGKCKSSGEYSNFQDAYCFKHKRKTVLTKVCNDFS